MAMSRMTGTIGRVLGERYRILSPLGTGSSAQVFLADDARLRRQVAVKVLHAALADDESFLRRFRAEAQAAAALSHPNILAVYDWSGEGDAPFLVTEHLSGGSLRSMLDAGHRLSQAQALVVGLETARALDHAHRQGFVHRDIKPANLLFGDDARLRVADFGLARAVAEAGWTEPTGAVLGTARYASPEQARGEAVDGRSDIYSLALVMIEAVTGVVPFSVDTTIGTLMARIDTPLTVPDEMGPLQPILEQAGSIDPADRPDAATLAAALVESAGQLTRPAPLPLAGTSAAAASMPDDGDATLLGPTATSAAVAGAAASDASAGDGATTVQSEMPTALPLRDGDTGVMPVVVDGGPGGDGPPSTPSPADRRARRLLLVGAGLVLALVAGVAGSWFWFSSSVPSHAVPAGLIGAQREAASDYIGDYGWRVTVEELRQDDTEPGEVVRTDPAPGSELKEGGRITLFVSLGPTLIGVPGDLVGLGQGDAEARLGEVGLTAEVIPEPSEDVAAGVVIGLGDVAAEVPKGSPVPLIVSSGPALREVPELAGRSFDEAADLLDELGLVPERASHWDRDRDAGEVVRTEPGSGAMVERGSTVVVVVATDRIEVPQIAGEDLDDAKDELKDAGLRVGKVRGPKKGEVYATMPIAGSEVEPDTKVNIFMR